MIRALLGLALVACNPAAQTPKPNSIKLYSIGHSLSSEIPDMVASLAKNTPGLKCEFQEQFRLGASLETQWNEAVKPGDKYDDKQFRAVLTVCTSCQRSLIFFSSMHGTTCCTIWWWC